MVSYTSFFRVYIIHTFASFFYRETLKRKTPSIHVNGSTAHLKGTPCKGGVAGQPRRYFCLGTPGRKKEAESSSKHPVSGMLASGKVDNVYIINESIHIEVIYEICINLCNLYIVFNASMNFDGHRYDLAKLL